MLKTPTYFLASVLASLAGLPSTSAFFLQKSAAKSNPLLSDLEALIEASQNDTGSAGEDEIKSLMVAISGSRKGDQRQTLPGQWELIFTTEKEVNFFKTSWPFAKVSSITQTIDPFKAKTVDNSINFDGGAEFAVIGTCAPADGDSEYDRIEFQFTSAVARVWEKDITLPPVGAGWFDTMYCNANYRLSQDNRGDWSVFKRIQ